MDPSEPLGAAAPARRTHAAAAAAAAGFVLLSALAVYRAVDVDVGLGAVHPQGSVISDRAAVSRLAYKQLLRAPGAVLERRFAHLSPQDAALDGSLDGSAELHVVVSRPGGHGALQGAALHTLCNLHRAVPELPGYEGVCKRGKSGACLPPFSVFTIAEAYAHAGVLDVLDSIDAAVRAAGGPGRAFELCASPAGVLAGDLCGPMRAAGATREDLEALVSLPRVRPDERGCEEGLFNQTALDLSLRFGRAVLGMADRSGEDALVQHLARPWRVLVDREFAGSDAKTSSVTRVAFLLERDDPVTKEGASLDFVRREAVGAVERVRWRARQTDSRVDVAWRQWDYFDHELGWTMQTDVLWAVGSFLFVFFVVCYVTCDGAVASCAMLSILLSFPLGLAVYVGLLRLTWFGILTVLSIFVVMGIGADDVFVLWEHWQQSPVEAGPVARMRVALRGAGASMLATSATTAAAFLANLVSHIAPVGLFGVFTAVLVIANFALVCSFFAACVVATDGLPSPCQNAVAMATPACVARCAAAARPERLRDFLAGPHLKFVERWRWQVNSVAVVGWSLCSVLASQLSGMQGMPSAWHHNHNQVRYTETEIRFEYGRRLEAISLAVKWGLDPSRVENHMLDPSHELSGPVPLDEGFGFDAPEEQTWLLGLCDVFLDPARRPEMIGAEEWTCPFRLFDDWLRKERGEDMGLPLPADEFNTELTSYVLQQSESDQGWVQYKPNSTVPVGTSFSFPIPYFPLTPYKELLAAWHRYEQWMDLQLETAPPRLRRGFQSSSIWQFAETEAEFVRSAQTSVWVSLVAASAVLVVVTGDLVVSALATACILGTVSVVGAFLWGTRWGLGLIESICVTVLVGLAIDYVVHIAVAYSSCEAEGRHERVRHAVSHLGVSVVCGAVTTVGASLFLCACTVAFFFKFGLFILVTLSASIVHAVVVFPALLLIFGSDSRDGTLGGRADRLLAQALGRARPEARTVELAMARPAGMFSDAKDSDEGVALLA